MLKYTEENKAFKAFIYKRIWSETVPAERWQNILKNAERECPRSGKEFCAEVIRAGEATPNRVAGGFSPPAPTPPGMRVRTGRFDEVTGP